MTCETYKVNSAAGGSTTKEYDHHMRQNVRLIDSDCNIVDSNNPIPVREHSFVDSNNSTIATLTANEEFVGSATEILNYGVITVSVYADQPSATDGLVIEQSADGTNWDWDDVYTISVAEQYSVQPSARYLRVRYTNGGTDQTAFRLQTILKPDYIKPSSHRIADMISDQDDAELVKAALTGEDPEGNWQNVDVTNDGNLTISDNSSGLAIVQGNVTGQTSVNKFGNAPDFDTGDNEVTVTDLANDSVTWQQMEYQFSSSADIDRLSSSDAGDTQDIEVQGLDSDYNLVTQTITLTGQTPVALTTPLIRVFRMKNVDSTDIAGYVFCFVNTTTTAGVPDTPANIRAVIENGNNQTEMAVYTVPAGKTGYIRQIYASTAGGSRATNYNIKLKIRPFGQVFQLKHRRAINDDKDLEKIFDTPEVATEKSDIIMTAQTTSTSITGSSLSAGFDIILVDN